MIDVGLEVDLLDRQAVQRLRLHVLDAVDVGADRILAVGGDPLLHLRRAEPGVAPDHGHDRDPDLRKDVGRHGADRDDAEKENERGHHIECVRKSQRESNNAHVSTPDPAIAGPGQLLVRTNTKCTTAAMTLYAGSRWGEIGSALRWSCRIQCCIAANELQRAIGVDTWRCSGRLQQSR